MIYCICIILFDELNGQLFQLNRLIKTNRGFYEHNFVGVLLLFKEYLILIWVYSIICIYCFFFHFVVVVIAIVSWFVYKNYDVAQIICVYQITFGFGGVVCSVCIRLLVINTKHAIYFSPNTTIIAKKFLILDI